MSQLNEEHQLELEHGSAEDGSVAKTDSTAEEQTANEQPEERVDVKESNIETKSARTDAVDEQITQLQSELNKYKDVALRSVADLDNYRKRMAREKDDAIRYANAGFLERLIPIIDNFELGLQAAKAGGSQSAVLDGMSMVSKQLQDFLSSCGVETIDATGLRFDPNVHEAIAQEWSKEIPEGFVVRQLRKGYRLKDRLIRPANVVVSKGAPVGENSAKAGAGT
jgi:molecular chaperone GrpE